ncbi:hypothetical protein TSOC_003710 [Tetrabaena socialis]|uniref:Uncharacterized protein n=1 Tax=Tetrabaena socialis TaxID=47790 RepID=A0A2J8AAT7_9CHLO|nr:hypothetical protein TSOC_003710 [Tetrabaena socialis]|eukprot:PNH09632.1 hypothetical protein TSOC_003710 [Tetrabaena socialis]
MLLGGGGTLKACVLCAALRSALVGPLLSSGLLPVLVGQLRAAGSSPLEQQLLVSGLGLLLALARVDAGARARLAALRGVAAALAAALGHEAAVVRGPALQLLQELILTKKGLEQVRSSAALAAALDRLCGEEGEAQGEEGGSSARGAQPPLQRQARLARSTIAALAALIK